MAGVNKAILIGNLGRDPELRYTQNGTAVASFTLATTEKSKEKEFTEWHRVVAWGRTAEVCAQYLNKGSKVYIEGRIQTREWEKDGQKHKTTEIVALNVRFLDAPKQGAGNNTPNTPRAAADEGPPPPDGDDIPF